MGHPEVKPELPEGISHLSLGQTLPSSMAAGAAAQPTAVQDLTQASDAFPLGLLMDSGGSWHWLFLTAAEARPARKRSGRHVCPECLQARDGRFLQMDGGNFQKGSLMDAQESEQQGLPARWQTWGLGWKLVTLTMVCCLWLLPVQHLILSYVWLFQVIKDPPPPPPAPKEVQSDGADLTTLLTWNHSCASLHAVSGSSCKCCWRKDCPGGCLQWRAGLPKSRSLLCPSSVQPELSPDPQKHLGPLFQDSFVFHILH